MYLTFIFMKSLATICRYERQTTPTDPVNPMIKWMKQNQLFIGVYPLMEEVFSMHPIPKSDNVNF